MPKLNQNNSYVITIDNEVKAIVRGSKEYAKTVLEVLAMKEWKKYKAQELPYTYYYKVYRKHYKWKVFSAKTFSELEG